MYQEKNLATLHETFRYEFEDPKVEVQFDCLRSFLHEPYAGPLTAIQVTNPQLGQKPGPML
jgi:hypothetical protein